MTQFHVWTLPPTDLATVAAQHENYYYYCYCYCYYYYYYYTRLTASFPGQPG